MWVLIFIFTCFLMWVIDVCNVGFDMIFNVGIYMIFECRDLYNYGCRGVRCYECRTYTPTNVANGSECRSYMLTKVQPKFSNIQFCMADHFPVGLSYNAPVNVIWAHLESFRSARAATLWEILHACSRFIRVSSHFRWDHACMNLTGLSSCMSEYHS